MLAKFGSDKFFLGPWAPGPGGFGGPLHYVYPVYLLLRRCYQTKVCAAAC